MKLVRPLVPDSYTFLAHFTIPGQPVSFKNRQRIIGRGKFSKIIKSKEAMAYSKSSIDSVPKELHNKEWGALDDPLALYLVSYYENRRSDLHTDILKDALQETGMIKNDRYIREIHALGGLDNENPRTEVYLYLINTTEMVHFTGESIVKF